jgi:hypothetical protein
MATTIPIMKLTTEEIELNRSGTLSPAQLKSIRGKGITRLISGLCVLAFVPMGIFVVKIHPGVMMILWIVGGLAFAGVFLWSAWNYLFIKPDGHEIQKVSGVAEKKNTGNKNVVIKIAERSFFMTSSQAMSLKDGEDYTLFFLENPRLPLGWFRNNE